MKPWGISVFSLQFLYFYYIVTLLLCRFCKYIGGFRLYKLNGVPFRYDLTIMIATVILCTLERWLTNRAVEKKQFASEGGGVK